MFFWLKWLAINERLVKRMIQEAKVVMKCCDFMALRRVLRSWQRSTIGWNVLRRTSFQVCSLKICIAVSKPSENITSAGQTHKHTFLWWLPACLTVFPSMCKAFGMSVWKAAICSGVKSAPWLTLSLLVGNKMNSAFVRSLCRGFSVFLAFALWTELNCKSCWLALTIKLYRNTDSVSVLMNVIDVLFLT